MNPSPENRFERRKRHTRQALIQAAGEILLEKGYDAMTIQDITDRADVGRGTFYLHFSDKEALVWDMLREHSTALAALTDAQVLQEPFPRREYLSWVLVFRSAQQTRRITNAIMSGAESWPLYLRLLEFVIGLHADNLSQQRYSARRNLPPAFMAHFMGGALLQTLAWWLRDPADYSPEQMADMFFEMIYGEPPSAEVKAVIDKPETPNDQSR
jgi:AcrR family transcriptional regulator